MGYEWDETKRQSNVQRHGIDFLDVIPCFADSQRLVQEDTRRDYGEPRFHLLCPLRGYLCHVSFTERGQNIRLISARRANQREQRTMSSEHITKAIATTDGRVLIEQPDGTYRLAESQTDWARLDAMSAAEVERLAAEDMAELGIAPDWMEHSRVVFLRPKERVTVRLDHDIVDWLKGQGRGYQARINAILRAYMDALKARQ
jgi:hypothetical protein